MKTIFRVAKTELRTLFYSPIAWFLIIVFFIQCGMQYMGVIKAIARTQELGGEDIRFLDRLTTGIFVGFSGLFNSVIQTLYLYIPLLTMSLISRETGSGTIKLLYSSPVKVREIVLGKFLSMLLYNLLLTAIVAVFVLSGIVHIQHPEAGMLMTALLGFYLLLCAYAAIGLFMSTLTTYQVVAAIASFLMIGILSYIGQVWQRIGFVRELTYFLSISGRTQKMLQGLLTTKDVTYFIVIMYLFLGFSIYRLKGGMESRPWTVKALRFASVLAIGLLAGYITSIPGFIGYYDATNNKTNTITPKVQQIVKNLGDDPLEVTAYANLVDGMYRFGDPDSYNLNIARWGAYFQFKPNIKLKTISYYDSALADPFLFATYPGKNLVEIAGQFAKKHDMELGDYLTPQQMRKVMDLRPEANRYVMQLKWKDRSTWLRVFNDSQAWPSETEVAVALRRLQGAKVPKVAFVTGHLERDIDKVNARDYKVLTNTPTFRYSFVNQGFDVQTVALDREDIPADIATLVLADPKIELTTGAITRLTDYINKGGNLLIAGEPGKQAIVNPLLKGLGVQLMGGMMIQENDQEVPTMVMQDLSAFAGIMYKPMANMVRDSVPVSMPVAAALSFTDSSKFTRQVLLTSKPKITWNRVKPFDSDVMITARADSARGSSGNIYYTSAGPKELGLITYSRADGDAMGPLVTAVSLTRKINNKEQRIIVAGDADFISNIEMSRWGTSNFIFSTAIFSWLSDSEFPIDGSRPDAKDKRINVTLKQAGVLRIVYIWVVPGILLVFGTVLLIRRKRK